MNPYINAYTGACRSRPILPRPTPRRFKVNIERSEEKKGAWCWEIVDQDGNKDSWGATLGSKKDVLAGLQPRLDRLHGNEPKGWVNQYAKKMVTI